MACYANNITTSNEMEAQDKQENGIPTRDEPIIQADQHRLREALDNLFENAISYSPEGGAIEVVVRPLVASRQASRGRPVPGNSDHEKSALSNCTEG